MDKRLLLVEGKDDEYVIKHLCKAHGITNQFEIEQPKGTSAEEEGGGVERLLDQIAVRLKESDIERVAVVLDADLDANRRWVQIRDRLRQAGFTSLPELLPSDGAIVDMVNELGVHVRFGVWIMPDNRLPGMLENFLAFLVPDDDRLLPHVDRFLANIPQGDRRYSDKASPKARIHCYLAIQEQPGKPLGLAITFRYLDAKCLQAAPFMKWLETTLVN